MPESQSTTLIQSIQFLSDHFSLITVSAFAIMIFFLIRRKNKKSQQAEQILSKAHEKNLHEPLSLHPEIDPALCAGCGACVLSCPEGKIIQLINHRAELISPTKCVGHGECERACPYAAITLVFGTKTRGMDIPRISSDYETNVPGLYIAGELGGMGLIRNAVKQGASAAAHALENKNKKLTNSEVLDLFIIGAGPAGMAASLLATERKANYLCIDQNSFGGTVFNFPRQKIVMTQPAEVPIFGKMKFPKNKVTKEELLDYWNSIRAKAQLKIHEKVKFNNITKSNGVFIIETSEGTYLAKKVVLAVGLRGSPRRLGLAGEDSPKVAYNLIEPQQYQNAHIAIVGAGNSALEAAQALSRAEFNNHVTILVRGSDMKRAHEENQNKISDMEKQGRLKIFYNSKVSAIKEDKILVSNSDQNILIKNDFLFVFAGAELPHKFLMSLGIKIDKKFGEALENRK